MTKGGGAARFDDKFIKEKTRKNKNRKSSKVGTKE